MSQSQRSVLERALRGEEILFEDMEQLAADVFECFDTAGVAYTSLPPIEVAPGLLMPQYSFTEPETGLSAPDRCIDYHEFYAAMAYASQPSTVEALDREFDRNIPAMIECVRRAGVDIDDDASRAEVEAAIDAALLAAEPEMCDYRAWL